MGEVVTDSVPSPPRQFQTKSGIKPDSPSVSLHGVDQPVEKDNVPSSPRQTCAESETSGPSTSKPNVKPNKHKNYFYNKNSNKNSAGEKKILYNISVMNSDGVQIGNNQTINYNFNGAPGKETREKVSMSQDDKKKLKELESSQKPVVSADLLVVSPFLSFEGIEIVSKKLDIKQAKWEEFQKSHQHKGPSELCVRVLEYWRTQCESKPENAAMVNILSRALKSARDKGGFEAIRALHERHFPSS